MIKPIEIYNMWIGTVYGGGKCKMYLMLNDSYEHKTIKITGKGKKYENDIFKELSLYKNLTNRWGEPNDLFVNGKWFYNLSRQFDLKFIHIYEQFELHHFETKDNELTFVFKLVKDKVEFL